MAETKLFRKVDLGAAGYCGLEVPYVKVGFEREQVQTMFYAIVVGLIQNLVNKRFVNDRLYPRRLIFEGIYTRD